MNRNAVLNLFRQTRTTWRSRHRSNGTNRTFTGRSMQFVAKSVVLMHELCWFDLTPEWICWLSKQNDDRSNEFSWNALAYLWCRVQLLNGLLVECVRAHLSSTSTITWWPIKPIAFLRTISIMGKVWMRWAQQQILTRSQSAFVTNLVQRKFKFVFHFHFIQI